MDNDGQTPAKVKATEAARILKAVGVLSSATTVSRVLGLLRDALAGALFGLGGAMDAFLVAFRIPNMMRALLAEGSLSVSFIPVFVELSEGAGGEERANRLARVALTLLLLVLVVVVAAGILFAPQIVSLTAFGFAHDPEKFALAAHFTKIVFPFAGLVAITGILGGVLNARGVFVFPALAPVALNVCIILSSLFLAPFLGLPIEALAWGVLIGGVAQLALQLKPAAAVGFRYRPDFSFRDPALVKVLKLMGPSIFGVAVYQINVVISTFLASWLPDGSVSFLYYAERLFQLPLGVFAVSIGVASLPSLSRLAAREEWGEFTDTVRTSIRFLWFIVIPASDGLYVLAAPIVTLLFQRGLFTADMSAATAEALRYFAPALLPVATTRVIAQGFYAMKDTRTPVKGAALALVVNIVASLLLMGPMRHAGLALATTISATVNSMYLSYAYYRRTGHLPFGELGVEALKIFAASTAMAVVVWLLALGLESTMAGANGTVALAGAVFGSIFVGIAVYGGAAWALGISEAVKLAAFVRGRG